MSLKPFLNHGHLIRPTDWANEFGRSARFEVEIGFGNGEYLAKLSAENPSIDYLGFEQYCERIHRTLRKLSRSPNHNVRVLRLDAKAGFERYIASRSVDKIHCLYPPPWPKKSDAKHRLFTSQFFRVINDRLKDGGVFLLVTDWAPYIEWIKEQIPSEGFDWQLNHITPNYGTKFENKWVGEGQQEFYEMVFTKTVHLDEPPIKDAIMQMHVLEHFEPKKFELTEISEDNVAVGLKDIMYDPTKQVAIVYAVVTDEGVTQHVRIVIVKTDKGWSIRLAEGTLLMPTAGVAQALALVARQAKATVNG